MFQFTDSALPQQVAEHAKGFQVFFSLSQVIVRSDNIFALTLTSAYAEVYQTAVAVTVIVPAPYVLSTTHIFEVNGVVPSAQSFAASDQLNAHVTGILGELFSLHVNDPPATTELGVQETSSSVEEEVQRLEFPTQEVLSLHQ